MMGLVSTARLTLALILAATIASTSAERPPRIRILTEEQVVDLMVGSAIQGTRSSNTAQMIERARSLLRQGGEFRIVAADEVPDDWTIVQAAGAIGGGGAWDHVAERMVRQGVPTVDNPTLVALEVLSKHIGRRIDAIVRNEAAGATLAAFQTAIAAGLPVVDACPAGRAKPEVQQSLTFIAGLPITPAVLVSRWGDVVIVDKAVDDYRYEDLARALAMASGGSIANARGAISGRDLKRVAIPGALSEAILFGRTVREARERGTDPVAALLGVCGGCVKLFEGVVRTAETKGERGHTYTDAYLEGVKEYAGHTYRVWVKNENILAWLDDRIDVMSPDFIYNLDPATGDALASRELGAYPVGAAVVIVGRTAVGAGWRTPRGLEVIGPRHFGFDIDYVPLETLLKTRPRL